MLKSTSNQPVFTSEVVSTKIDKLSLELCRYNNCPIHLKTNVTFDHHFTLQIRTVCQKPESNIVRWCPNDFHNH